MAHQVPHDDRQRPVSDIERLRAILRVILNRDQQALLEAFGRVRDAAVREALILITQQAADPSDDEAESVSLEPFPDRRRMSVKREITPERAARMYFRTPTRRSVSSPPVQRRYLRKRSARSPSSVRPSNGGRTGNLPTRSPSGRHRPVC